MVDANAVVLLPSTGLVVPKCIGAGTIVSRPDCVEQPQMVEGAEFLACARQEQRVVHPARGEACVEFGWNDIEIPAENQRLFQVQALTHVVNESVHPADFVYIFLSFWRIAV